MDRYLRLNEIDTENLHVILSYQLSVSHSVKLYYFLWSAHKDMYNFIMNSLIESISSLTVTLENQKLSSSNSDDSRVNQAAKNEKLP